MPDYKIPSQPVNLFKMPFADEGDKVIISDTASPGRASLSAGFPQSTQLPLRDGGVAPNRLDFQGILYMLSAFAFWQQSGGMFSYNNTLNYAPPAVVYHNDILWWCNAANGPGTEVGAVEPGTDDACWTTFMQKLSSGGSGGGTNPVGAVIMYHDTTAPAGYLACDGAEFSVTDYPRLYALLGKSTTPDLRGLFVRGFDPAGKVDPDGATRAIGSKQADAGRNATGTFASTDDSPDGTTGVFRIESALGTDDGRRTAYKISMDLARAWGNEHTASEFRGVNANLLYCIKHD